jgi:hypothetical protein
MSTTKAIDLDALKMPKDDTPPLPLEPAAAAAPVGTEPKGYAHTLSYRMTDAEYRQLRRFVADYEDRTGKRLTHQSVINAALTQWLKDAGK